MGAACSRRRSVLFEERRVSDAVVEFSSCLERGRPAAGGALSLSAGAPANREGHQESSRAGRLLDGGSFREDKDIKYESQMFWCTLFSVCTVFLIVSVTAKLIFKVSF
jgi:hypothetical protein